MNTTLETSITCTLTSSDVLRTISLHIENTQFKQLTRHIWLVDNYVHLFADTFEKWSVF